jgi:5-methylcytosine-specific restriction endonuclease McrA
MGLRQRAWANRAKAKLIAELGGECVMCGTTEDLEIDHLYKREWSIRNTEFSWRISKYRKEAALGLLQLLCGDCNKFKGRPTEDAPVALQQA